ncbi:Sec1-like protein [Mycena olivaceomarginata]|nr:Sec1-like protein [Mycena olivaceomarginata]
MASLITTVRSKFLEAIRSILVVDEHAQKLLGSVLKQFDILEENVTPQNIDRIIKDFSGARQYAAAHLFFIDGLEESLFERLASSPAEPNLRAVKEFVYKLLGCPAAEAQTFSLQAPEFFFGLYSPPRSKIANVCITLNEFPFIRYYVPPNHAPLGPLKPHSSTRPPPPPESSGRWRTNLARGAEARAYESVEGDYGTKILAFYVQNVLDEYKKANPDFAKPSEPPRPRGTLFITDRAMDMIAPFVHEFTYQAMANDLLPIEGGTKYTYKFQSSVGAFEDKTATLTDADTVWTEVRHMHMREAIDKLMADFNRFLEENAVFKGEGAASLNDMKEMLASLPQYQEQREKFSLHLNMAQECMGLFEKDKLPLVATIEQDCATGLTAEGKTPKNLVQDMVPLLDSREVINPNKVRIVALYIQFRDWGAGGGSPATVPARAPHHSEQEAVNALVHMGVRITRYELSRYKPVLRDHVADKLDKTLFPRRSLRSQKPSWHKAAARPGGSAADLTRARLLVFVAGGMTYSEIREAYQLSTSLTRDVYIGSSHTITPREFISDLSVLELGGTGSKAIPNGQREGRAARPAMRSSPADSYSSNVSVTPSMTPSAVEEKKKKKGLFRF